MSELQQGGVLDRVRWYKEVRVKGNLQSVRLFTGVTLPQMLGYHVIFWHGWPDRAKATGSNLSKRGTWIAFAPQQSMKGWGRWGLNWIPTGWNRPQKQYEKEHQSHFTLYGRGMFSHRLLQGCPQVEWGQEKTPEATEEAPFCKPSWPDLHGPL